ncbi:hypothetical protein A1O7_05171 [Cladophialophora yegresii CBS 114405]|uniref:Uncharacterized protein n=1 Tax=Cladophialophora yegresii CBS 114405 TaxID=1182544 RepID=W9VZC4_9EURO|nr:uncharacterized protein A1O7_05171 [Cladophialophora yegresii CBS 114405]EXJ61018.1 hypothetical protein A1O7_05171 [Cladophialophora yegresii CBS 114405]
MDSPQGTRYFDANLDDGAEETILPGQNVARTHLRFDDPENPEPRNTQGQTRDTRGKGPGWGRRKGRGIEKVRERETKPMMQAKYAMLEVKYEVEKRNSNLRIADQRETIATLENDKDRLQEQNAARQALVAELETKIAELEKKLVKTNKTVEQHKRLVAQQEKALAGMAMKLGLGDADTMDVGAKIERD